MGAGVIYPGFFIMGNVKNNQHANRYEMRVGDDFATVDYRLEGSKLIILHVEVPEALHNRGLASELMYDVVADAKARHLTIVPVCSYAVAYLERHPIKP